MKTDNELIAEFMGPQACYYRQGNRKVYEYDTSWDWLMPVVEKIGNLYDGRSMVNCEIFHLSLFAERPDIYKAVIEFIKWYNDQKNATLQIHPKEA